MKKQEKSENMKTGLIVAGSIIAIIVVGLIYWASTLECTGPASRDLRRETDLEQLQEALDMYKRDNRDYPSQLTELDTYMNRVPKDPTTDQSYKYKAVNNKSGYCIGTCLTDDIHDPDNNNNQCVNKLNLSCEEEPYAVGGGKI
ncbi:MAG: hypothetical protein BRC25_02815 [Parcubacteria group bacterium SW_6_46_9]|nr:MAG: hypothetical protein BRC25_02815 [Parcubacteria group bacterium SW_6_46_9]